MKKCILFTDIKGSCSLWNKYPRRMLKALRTHDSEIRKCSRKFGGFIIKTIGDAYMISFDDIYDGINFAIEMCLLQENSPIIVGNSDKLQIRIGMSYGTVNQKRQMIQNKSLLDYFGPTVNSASRMESKISPVKGFAFSILGKLAHNTKIIKYLNSKSIDVGLSYYMYDVPSCEKILKRSERLLYTNQIFENKCKNPSQLKGIYRNILTYECNLRI